MENSRAKYNGLEATLEEHQTEVVDPDSWTVHYMTYIEVKKILTS